MMKNKKVYGLAAVVLAVCLMAACSASASSSSAASQAASSAGQQQGNYVYGQVTAIDGDDITLALGEMAGGGMEARPEGGNSGVQGEAPASGESRPEGQTPPEGGTSGSMPELPEGQSGSMPQPGEGEGQQGQGGARGGFTATGEETTISATGVSITLKGQDGESAGSISDIAVGEILQIEMDGDTVVSIVVQQSGGMPGGQGEGGQQGEPQSQSAA
ncbi:MAG: hypothetical protein ACK5L3_00645 [Oscillospiraceae bacterium]